MKKIICFIFGLMICLSCFAFSIDNDRGEEVWVRATKVSRVGNTVITTVYYSDGATQTKYVKNVQLFNLNR